MEVGRSAILGFTLVVGALVLTSYAIGVRRFTKASDLWGGVTPAMQKVIIPLMLLAAAGFLVTFILLLFKADAAVLANLRWPWGGSDGQGGGRLLLGLALLLIPSALWLEATRMHLVSPQPWTPALIITILGLVALGNVLLILLFTSAYQDRVAHGGWMLAGMVALGVQTIVNDFVIWNLKFPW